MTNSTDQEREAFDLAYQCAVDNGWISTKDLARYMWDRSRAQQPASVAVPEAARRDAIYNTLRNYRMSTLDDGEGGGYPLIDAMTADGQTVAGGIEECDYLADALVDALAAAPHPVSGEQKQACPVIRRVRPHSHKCANVQINATSETACDCGAVVNGVAVEVAPAAQGVAGLVEALMSCTKAASAAEVGLIVDAALAAHRAQQAKQ